MRASLEDPSTDRIEDLATELGLALEVFSGGHRDPWEPGLEVLGYQLLELGELEHSSSFLLWGTRSSHC